jgi:branched-chain amino acid transport system substrate-binding protein
MKRRVFFGTVAVASQMANPFSAAGASTEPIKIGQSVILSGPIGAQAQAYSKGAQLVFNRVNRSGGVNGRPIELISLDDGLVPDQTAKNTVRLLSEFKVSALFGYIGGRNLRAALESIQQSGVPLLGAVAIPDSLRLKTRDSAYYLRAGYGRELQRVVQQLSILGVTAVALAHMSTPDGEEVKQSLAELLTARGMAPAANIGVALDGSNAAAAAEALAAAKPQAVIVFVPGAAAAKLIGGMEKRGSSPDFYCMSVVPAELTAKEAGSSRMRGIVTCQVMPYPWNDISASILEFRKLAAASGMPVSYTSMEGYVAGTIVAEALKRAGRNTAPAKLHSVIRTLKGNFCGLDIDFTSSNTGSSFVELVQISGSGRFSR